MVFNANLNHLRQLFKLLPKIFKTEITYHILNSILNSVNNKIPAFFLLKIYSNCPLIPDHSNRNSIKKAKKLRKHFTCLEKCSLPLHSIKRSNKFFQKINHLFIWKYLIFGTLKNREKNQIFLIETIVFLTFAFKGYE